LVSPFPSTLVNADRGQSLPDDVVLGLHASGPRRIRWSWRGEFGPSERKQAAHWRRWKLLSAEREPDVEAVRTRWAAADPVS
ncbi:MAG TPA: hypothetical protein VLE71_02945, partial [Actinomycetota bacterium]|nr:hypothetical protein [Actinomycetota bacterium]